MSVVLRDCTGAHAAAVQREKIENITQLPHEVQLYFVNKLDRVALISLQKTCKCFNNLMLDESIWKNLFSAENRGRLPKIVPVNWREFYVEQHILKQNIQRGQAARPLKATLTGSRQWGTFTYKNIHFVLQGFSELAYYDLTTGKMLGTHKEIPKEAFASPSAETVRLRGVRLMPIDTDHFVLDGTIVSIWNAQTNACVFACMQPILSYAHVSDSKVIHYSSEEAVEVCDYKTKQTVASFASAHPYGRMHAIGSALFTVAGGCMLNCYDYEKKRYIVRDWKFKEYRDKTECEFLQTPGHLVALTACTDRPKEFVAACVNLQKNSSATIQLEKPQYFLAGLDTLEDIAVVQDEWLFGIDKNDKQAVSCWNLNSDKIEKCFRTPRDVWTFKVTDFQNVIATVCDTPHRFRLFIWDIDNPEQPRLEIESESFDCVVHNNLLCLREVAQFRFFDLSHATELGAIPFTAFEQRPIFQDIYRTSWTFDGSRIHIEQPDTGTHYYWIVNLTCDLG